MLDEAADLFPAGGWWVTWIGTDEWHRPVLGNRYRWVPDSYTQPDRRYIASLRAERVWYWRLSCDQTPVPDRRRLLLSDEQPHRDLCATCVEQRDDFHRQVAEYRAEVDA